MDEVENKAVVNEVPAPETTPEVNHSQETSVDSKKEYKWGEMRRMNNELEKKAKMQEELIAQLLSAQKQAPVPVEKDELDSVPDEDYIPKGQVKKLLHKEREQARKIAQEEAQKVLQQQEQAKFLDRLKSKFSDFDEVVTPETLEILETEDPELAKSIAEVGDPYKMGLQTYKYIKSMNLGSKVPSSRRVKEVEKKIAQNEKSVQSPQAYDKRPMAQTFEMTEALKNELYKEMMGFARMASGVPQQG